MGILGGPRFHFQPADLSIYHASTVKFLPEVAPVKFKLCIASVCFALCAVVCAAQQALTNESVMKMAKAGLSENVIVSMIQSQPGDYTVTPDAMIALKNAGVTEKELAAMAVKGTTAAAPAAPHASEYAGLDIGVYYKINGQWTIVPTERVNWKTGGFLKSLATDGIVKGDVNGRLKGSASQTKLFTPLVFLVKAPDGMEATDFQLVHLHEKKHAREFRTVTGGVFHSSGGSSRDAVQFQQKQIARRTYEVTFSAPLPPGEYAFLAPGFTGSSASGSTGKAYTFHLTE